MIRLKNIIQLFLIFWKSKEKVYLLISDKGVKEYPNYPAAKKAGLELIKNRDIDSFRIALELSVVEFMVEIKK